MEKERYIAFRIDTSTIKSWKVVNGFFVRGQRESDLNWPIIGEFSNMDEAKAFVKQIRTDPIRQTVYGPNGYGIKL